MRCSWCSVDPNEAAARHKGPHLTWCVHYRRPLPNNVMFDLYSDDGRTRADVRSVVDVKEVQ